MKKILGFTLLLLLFSLGISSQPLKIDSLFNALKTAKEDSNKVIRLNSLCEQFYFSSQFKIADSLARASLALAEKLSYKKGIAISNGELGNIYSLQGNNPMALGYLEKCYEIFKEIRNKKATANVLGNIGGIYEAEGNYAEALNNYLQSLKLCEETGNKKAQANAYSNIGNVYFALKNYDEALKYQMRGLELNQELDNKIGLVASNNNISIIYKAQGKYEEAINVITKALSIAKSINEQIGLSNAYANLGAIYCLQKDYPKALNSILEAIAVLKKIGSHRTLATSYDNAAVVLMYLKNYTDSKKYFDSALLVAKAEGNKNDLRATYGNRVALDSITGNLTKALEDSRMSSIYHDSILNDETNKKIMHEQMTYDFDKKEAVQKAEQDRKDAVRDSEEARQKTVIWLIASITLTLVLLLIIIFQRMKDVEKKKLIAEQQKAWLELKALRTQMNPHFLYNTINSIQSFVLNNDSKSSYNYLAQFAGLMRSTLDNSRKEKISLADEVEGLKNYLDFEAMRFPTKFNYEFSVDPNLDQAKTFIPPLLVQPFVENAIWHGLMHLKNSEGKLLINFVKENDCLKCIVDDNGIGRSAAAELKKNSVHKSAGLAITEERMESMNKMYHWDMKTVTTDKTNTDGTPAGTRVELYLPLIQNPVVYA